MLTGFSTGCDNLNLWVDHYACVGTPNAATPMPGIVSNCSRYYLVVSGDSCGVIASKAGITAADFYKWNTSIDSGCTNLWLDALVCTKAWPALQSNQLYLVVIKYELLVTLNLRFN